MLQALREEVLRANLLLPKSGLVLFTWGNVSGIDREAGLVVIKPSGVPYEELTADNMVICDLCGKVIEGDLRPSSDLATHLVLYKAFPGIGGVTHTHSPFAAAFAQAGRELPCYGTTHADYFYGTVPVTRNLTAEEIDRAYEAETGTVIIEAFAGRTPEYCPAVLVRGHGPFTWGTSAMDSVHNAVVLEECCKMAVNALSINPNMQELPRELRDKHFYRKHGPNAYYGQK